MLFQTVFMQRYKKRMYA